MKEQATTNIHVHVGGGYSVLVEEGLLDRAGACARDVIPVSLAVIVSDDRVFPLYGERLSRSLAAAGFAVKQFVFPHGEAQKSPDTLLSLWRFLAENRVTRKDALFALGGGVTGDLCGFAAATYLRGVHLVQVPTSLLAMVDSSVGGKTAVDLPEGKNLVGAFYQPSLVLCDPLVLTTLPAEELRCGMAEVIKYAFINRKEMLPLLEKEATGETLRALIEESIRDKAEIVACDERDTGVRQLLNLGHTAAHGIELLSGYTLSHGDAVAVGTVIATRAAVRRGLCERAVLDRLLALLTAHGLPTETALSGASLAEAALGDKKRAGGEITLVIPVSLGRSELRVFPVEELKRFFEDGTSPF